DMQRAAADEDCADVRFELATPGDSGCAAVVFAHKAVLSSRCEYFARLWQGAWRDSSSALAPIDGLDADTYALLMRYVYGGDEQIVDSEDVLSVLEAADRFLMDELKEVCEHALELQLDTDNWPLLLTAAERCAAPRLKRAAMEYAAANWAALVAS